MQLSRAVRRRLELRVRPCIRSEVNVDVLRAWWLLFAADLAEEWGV